jgi:hypothetical protein
MGAEDFDAIWEVHGDVPTTDPGWLVEPAEEHFQRKAHDSNRNIPHDHEVATVIKDKIVPVFKEHKKGIIEVTAAALTVAGVLLAAHEICRRKRR